MQRLERGPSGARKTPKVDPYNDNQFQDVSTMVPFFAWLEQHGIGGLVDIEPFHVAA